jgi:hypothetical protein
MSGPPKGGPISLPGAISAHEETTALNGAARRERRIVLIESEHGHVPQLFSQRSFVDRKRHDTTVSRSV